MTALSNNNKSQDVVRLLSRKQKQIHDKPTSEILQEKNLSATASFPALFTHSQNENGKQNYIKIATSVPSDRTANSQKSLSIDEETKDLQPPPRHQTCFLFSCS